jgi:predicted molibdopterin-dependent oxidoreductase YjgC
MPEPQAPLHGAVSGLGRRCGTGGSRGRELRFTFDGQEVLAFEGETIAAALLATGRRAFRQTARREELRGLFCGLGVCFDCLVCIDGRPNVRACQAPVAADLRVESQQGRGVWEEGP